MSRSLLIVPVLHNAADLGSLAPHVREVYERLAGPSAWEEHRQAVEGLWNAVERLLAGRNLEPSKTRLYQDGLPVCNQVKQIVEEVAARGSRNHILLNRLAQGGAQLEGTEDPVLLRLEYQRIKQMLDAPPTERSSQPVGPDALNTAERDHFIAAQIDRTLQEGETGVLFVGLLHRVEDHLSPGIDFEFLLPRPQLEVRARRPECQG